MKILVIGGTQFIGKHLVTSLAKAGHEVSILHRGVEHGHGKKVVNLQANRNDIAQVKSAVSGKQFDAVFDFVYDWEHGTPATTVEQTAKLLTGNISRYVFMSSVSAYGDGLNHHEGDALAADNHPDRYVREKAQSERALFRLHQRHGTPVVTIRSPFAYGPDNPIYREQFFWDRVRDKRPVILPGDGRRLMQFAYVKDIVWACQRVLEVPAAIGHAFNIGNARPVTQCEVLDAFFTAAGKPTEVLRVPRERIARAGGHPMGPNLYFGMYFDLPPITSVISKAQRVLGLKPTLFCDGLKETYRWYARHYDKKAIDYAFEDRLLQRERSQLAS